MDETYERIWPFEDSPWIYTALDIVGLNCFHLSKLSGTCIPSVGITAALPKPPTDLITLRSV